MNLFNNDGAEERNLKLTVDDYPSIGLGYYYCLFIQKSHFRMQWKTETHQSKSI